MHSIHANNETCCIHRFFYTNMFVNNYLVGYTNLHIFIVGEIIEVSIKRSNNAPQQGKRHINPNLNVIKYSIDYFEKQQIWLSDRQTDCLTNKCMVQKLISQTIHICGIFIDRYVSKRKKIEKCPAFLLREVSHKNPTKCDLELICL